MTTPKVRSWTDDFDADQLNVFVPGAMGAGLLVSIGLLVSDLYRKAGGASNARRRQELTARATADATTHGLEAGEANRVGFRDPWVYGVVTAASLGLAAYLIPGTIWNYFNPGGYLSSIAWIWAVSTVAIVAFIVLGLTVATAAPRSLPVVVGGVGLVATVRFASWASPGWALVISLVLPTATIIGVWATYRYARRIRRVPARARPLFVATPLTRDPKEK